MKKVFKENNSNNLQSDSSKSFKDSVFSTIFNNNQAVMLLVDPSNHQIIDANGAAEKFYGYKRDKLVTMDMRQINILSSEERHMRMEDAINKPHGFTQFIHKISSGILKNVEVYTSQIIYNEKNVIFIIVHDITEQKEAELALKEREERFELAMAGSDLGIWDWWVQTGELHVNERWAEIIGYTLEEISPMSTNTWRELSHPEDIKEVDTQFQKYLNNEIDIYKCEVRMKHKDGSWIWIQTQGKVFEWTEDGKPQRMSGTHLDINEKKITEIRLAESEMKYKSFFESSPLSLWEEDYTDVITHLNTLPISGEEDIRNYIDTHPEELEKCSGMVKILDVNPATLKLFDAQSKEGLFGNLDKIFTADTYETFKDTLISIYHNKPIFSAETVNRTIKGKMINTKLEIVSLTGYRVLVTITDITESKKKELELRDLVFQTKADAETKEILLREINHRVKNNLSSFIGMLYAEKKQSGRELKEAQMEHVDSLINRVKGISIAHDLLSRSQWAPISLYSLSEKIVHSLNHLIPSDRSIKTEITHSSVFLDADQSHSMAVVINELFINCIEHASHEGGELKVNIEIIEGKGKITYIYCDNGPGFSEKILNYESYNVGLYLIKNIVEQNLRGSVIMENKDGARVILQFPGGVEFEEL
jgi:PAS domain S-box-containing protein